jgi:hypothetical protein
MERWYTPSATNVSITMSTDTTGIGPISATEVHTALLAALKTWTDVQCELCPHPGGAGCVPELCAAHPVGITLQDGGIAAHTQWGFPCGATNPDGSCKYPTPNGNFVVQITQKADWPWSQFDLAHTLVVSNQATGEIIDADILFNQIVRDDGSKFQYCTSNCANTPTAYPLCLPLTHEMGHVLGLDHSKVVKSTMAASAVPSDGYKCQLSDDDVAGVCVLYNMTCSGIPGESLLQAKECDERAKANIPEVTTPTPSCQATRRPLGGIWLLALGVSLIRLKSGRSRARPT